MIEMLEKPACNHFYSRLKKTRWCVPQAGLGANDPVFHGTDAGAWEGVDTVAPVWVPDRLSANCNVCQVG